MTITPWHGVAATLEQHKYHPIAPIDDVSLSLSEPVSPGIFQKSKDNLLISVKVKIIFCISQFHKRQ